MRRPAHQNFKRLFSIAALLLLNPMSLFACAVCYGEPDAPMTRGLTWAIVVLGGMIACVLAGVVSFFVHTKRKAAELAQTSFASAESVQRNA